ncbi:MAG TPA: fibronectin type III domain-containing protein [Verrucomicrobiae bacterium]|nr:fibronectin type III domain-containing protein [Verrucomicrobiae bacterium]
MHPCTPDDPHAGIVAQSPDFKEVESTDPETRTANLAGPIGPALGQPVGALSGRIVFTSGGHGWTAGASSWGLQRPVLLEMNEDYGNVDQMNLFATYCFNAGATVVPMRPLGNQTNEVVLDNDDAGVTFVGSWSTSTSTTFYGNPGDVPYRFASLSPAETATAAYTPNLPAAGYYPVYTWVRHGPDRTFQLYRIRHTGGESLVRVPHHMVGNGWVYLGTYYFDAGSNPTKGAVVISNLQPAPLVGSVVIADAIRFGNGMGSVDRGFGVSSYPREEECARYWVQTSLGQGQSAALYDPDLPAVTTDDGDDNVGAPIRMAREMNREAAENIYKRIFISFHSNAGGGRGVVGLWNDNANHPGTGTPNQFRLAQLAGLEVNNDLVGIGSPPLEVAWFNRGSSITATQTFAFGEIRNDTLGGEMDATIIEVAFHDDASDAALLRDPKVRNWIARAGYQAAVRYMNEFDAVPLTFVPEPPFNVRAMGSGSNVVLSWSSPVAQAGSGPVSGYLIYQSTNGYGFGNPVASGNVTSFAFTNLAANQNYFFRVAATNSGGQSMPSETVACRVAASPWTPRALIVNAFDRFDKSINIRQTPAAQNYKPPGHDANSGTMNRVLPARNNAFDYVVPHAHAVGAHGLVYDSCQNEAVSLGLVNLSNYPIVIWACGNESTADESFSASEQSSVSAFLAAGGSLFVSGSEIAWDLDRPGGPSAADRNFLHNQLRAAYAGDDSGVYTFTPVGGSIFNGNLNGGFDNGSMGIYAVGFPDLLTPTGVGASSVLNYQGVVTGAAAIAYDGSAGGGRVVYLGFPFETITSSSVRNAYMADALTFLLPQPAEPLVFDLIGRLPDGNVRLVLSGNPGFSIEFLTSTNLTQWSVLTNVPNPSGTVQITNIPFPGALNQFYRARYP